MPQLTYSLNMAPGFEGQISDSRLAQIDGFRNDGVVEIPFGKAVTRSANADGRGCKLPATGEVLLGIMAHSHVYEQQPVGLLPLQLGNVVSRGRMYVRSETAVTPASAVTVRINTGGAGAGSFGGTAPAAGAFIAVPQARFLSSAAAGELVEIDINLPSVPVLT